MPGRNRSADEDERRKSADGSLHPQFVVRRVEGVLPNYTLSTVCPSCGSETFRLACKVRCPRCGFAWDCSEV